MTSWVNRGRRMACSRYVSLFGAIGLFACSPDDRATTSTADHSTIVGTRDSAKRMSLAEFDFAVSDSAPFEALKRLLPKEYKNVAEQITSSVSDAMSDVEMANALRSAIKLVRKRNAEAAARAHDDFKRRWFDLRASSLDAIRASAGEDACGTYAQTGQMPLSHAKLAKAFDDQITLIEFEMIADGQSLSIPIAKPELEDQFLLTDDMIAAGITVEQLERYNAGDRNPALTCRYLLQAFRSAKRLEGEAGHRIRADFVRFNFAGL